MDDLNTLKPHISCSIVARTIKVLTNRSAEISLHRVPVVVKSSTEGGGGLTHILGRANFTCNKIYHVFSITADAVMEDFFYSWGPLHS